nr:MAG TPA: Replication associated protein [Microviridae sp.]
MKAFLSCNHPVKVGTLKGAKLVPCGKCIQCLTAKRRKTELLLSLETQSHKYCELINLTYNDEFIPWVDLSAINGKYTAFGNEFDSFMRSLHPVHFGDRLKNMYNPRTKQYYQVRDKYYSEQRFTSVFGYLERYICYDTFDVSQIYLDLEHYNKRIDEYYHKYPWRRRGVSRQKDHVAILWNEDLQRYLDRLKKWIRRTFGVKVRYFAIGEYGSNSLRPHWHIVLFHDSLQLRESFSKVWVYPNSTSQNPRECSVALRNASLWTFGDCTTTTTDGFASSYLSGYLNQSSSLPKLLKSFPPKTFKSTFLGENRDFKLLSSLLKSRDYSGLTTSYLVSRKGLKRPVPTPSTSYARFHIGYSFDGLQDLKDKFELLRSTKWFLNRSQINLYDDMQLRDALLWLSSKDLSSRSIDSIILRPLIRYCSTYAYPVYISRNSLNSLKSLFYASLKLHKMSHLLGLNTFQYLTLVDDFEKWYDYQNLINHLSMLEDNPILAYQYYHSFDDALGIPVFSKYSKMSFFISQIEDANMDWYSSIKHKDVVMSYKTDL